MPCSIHEFSLPSALKSMLTLLFDTTVLPLSVLTVRGCSVDATSTSGKVAGRV